MAPVRSSSRYNPDPTLQRPPKTDLEDNIRQRKAHSKRDMAKYAKEAEYARDPALKEVLPHSKCRRCLANHWRCFISSDPKSPRKVCKPCGKNKCSFGYSTLRPMTYEDDGADAVPDERVRAHAAHAGLLGWGSYAATGYGGCGGVDGGGVGGGVGGSGSGLGGGTFGGGAGGGTGRATDGSGAGGPGGRLSLDRESSSSSSSSARPTLSITTRDLTPRHLPLPALKSSFDAFQPLSRPPLRRVDTEPLSHSLSTAGHALSALSIKSEILSAPPLGSIHSANVKNVRPHSASSYAPPTYYDGYYCDGYWYPYQQDYYAQSYDARRSERGMEMPIPMAAAKVEP